MMKRTTLVLATLVLLVSTGCNNGITNPDISIDFQTAYTGVVLDAANSQALSGVRVDVGDVMLQTDANGRFGLYGLRKGTYTVTATKTGYAPYVSTITIEESKIDQKIYLTK